MYLLYSVLLCVAGIALLPWFAFRGLRQGKYFHSFARRFGGVPAEAHARAVGGPGAIWVHAASVGEIIAAGPLILKLKQKYPQRALYVSTTTETGQGTAKERLAGVADGFFYFPFDWAWCVRRTIRAVRPAIVVIVETEIWPNFLRRARRSGVPVVFVNARISKESAEGYQRANRWFGGIITRALGDATLFLVRGKEDARHLAALGVPREKLEIAGNLKYDLRRHAARPLRLWLEAELKSGLRSPVAVAGSVMAGEELPVFEAFANLQNRWPQAFLILAPRKPERFAEAANLASQRGFHVVRRSALDSRGSLDDAADVLVLDSIGELADLYAVADVTFVGGSIVPVGGHNILEPALYGKPPAFGPYMDNFQDIAGCFLERGAGAQVENGEGLSEYWRILIEDTDAHAAAGRQALRLIHDNRGATNRIVARLAGILESQASGR
jgi:3-deoxy-D-manno-octulosonic-acid transferase